MRIAWMAQYQRFVIAKGTPSRRQFFSFYTDGKPSWTKHLSLAHLFKTDSEAYAELAEVRKVARDRRKPSSCAPAQNPQGTEGGE